MDKNTFKTMVRLIVEETERELTEMWIAKEAGLTSEERNRLKDEIKDCMFENDVENRQ